MAFVTSYRVHHCILGLGYFLYSPKDNISYRYIYSCYAFQISLTFTASITP